jgi:uncharacterized protein (UPF0335 family)
MADFGGIAGDQLKSLIERIERLEEEKRALGEDIKEVYAEAKGTGFEPKIMRQLIKIRRAAGDSPDSPLEGTGSEPSVPRKAPDVVVVSVLGRADFSVRG